MNSTIVLLVVLVIIVIICFLAKYFQTNKLKENLTMTVTQSKSSSSTCPPKASGSMLHLDNSSRSCGQPLYSSPPSQYSVPSQYSLPSQYSVPVQKTALNSSPGCVDSECHKSMVGLFGNLFKNLPAVDKLPHITHTLQITPKNAGSVSTAATSAAANQHGNSIVPAQSSPASVPSSSSALKSITTAADCSAAGGKDFNYCPETGKYYCCGVTNSDYTVCGGTDGACPSNSGLQNCVCPSNLSSTPASVPPSSTNPDSVVGSWNYVTGGKTYVSTIAKSGSNTYSVTPITAEGWWSSATMTHVSGNTYTTRFNSGVTQNTTLSSNGNTLSFANGTSWSRSSSSSSALKSITTAAECAAAGGKDFNYCPETGKYYCCGVTNSDYTVCGGTDGACPSNSGLQNCVCPSNLSSTPASVPPSSSSSSSSSSSALKSITTAADCSAAGGKYFNYCPETGKYYCCGVTNSDYTVCGGTDGACPSNSGLQNCVCPSNLSSTPASVPSSSTNPDSVVGSWNYVTGGKTYVSTITKSGSNTYSVTPVTSEGWWSSATMTHNSGNTYTTRFSNGATQNTTLSSNGNTLSFANGTSWSRSSSSSSSSTYSPIGAFKDFVNGVRAMSKTISLDQDYSAEKCSTACNGYKYFGLQDPGSGGSQCFCSNSLEDTTQFGPYTPASNCTPNGAPNCNYVYQNK